MVELCNKINDKLSREVDGERVNAIKNVIKYWQFGPNELQDAADEFGADMCIPKGSKAFNALFFQQYEIVRQFICEVNKLGVAYKERIYRDFLGMEPPVDFDKDVLK